MSEDLKLTGFDIVSTANNHTLDRYSLGVDKTIAQLKQANIDYVGTRQTNTTVPFYTFTKKNSFKLMWIACTQDTNGIEDRTNQVLYCYKKKDSDLIRQAIQYYKNKVDIIIVTPHWGKQYQLKPSTTQRRYAKRWLEYGANIIISNHPHVLQPIQFHITRDNRQTLIAYSLGNFVSNQGSINNRLSGLLKITLDKTQNGTSITKASFIPTLMINRGDKLSLKKLHKSRRWLRKLRRQIDNQIFIEW